MKKKLCLIPFIIGIIPFILLLMGGIFYAISGMSTSFFGGTRYYGLRAFIDGIIFFSYLFWPLYIIGLVFILGSLFIHFKK